MYADCGGRPRRSWASATPGRASSAGTASGSATHSGAPTATPTALLLAAAGAPLHAQTESSEHSGRTAFSKQDYEGAALYFALAIEEDNEQPTRTKAQRADLFFMRGNSFFMLKKSAEAVEDFTKAFELMEKKDDDPSNRAARALVLNLRSQSQ